MNNNGFWDDAVLVVLYMDEGEFYLQWRYLDGEMGEGCCVGEGWELDHTMDKIKEEYSKTGNTEIAEVAIAEFVVSQGDDAVWGPMGYRFYSHKSAKDTLDKIKEATRLFFADKSAYPDWALKAIEAGFTPPRGWVPTKE